MYRWGKAAQTLIQDVYKDMFPRRGGVSGGVPRDELITCITIKFACRMAIKAHPSPSPSPSRGGVSGGIPSPEKLESINIERAYSKIRLKPCPVCFFFFLFCIYFLKKYYFCTRKALKQNKMSDLRKRAFPDTDYSRKNNYLKGMGVPHTIFL